MKPALSFRPALALLAGLSAAAGAFAQSAPPPAAGTRDEPVLLSEFEVATERDTGYRANNAVSATRTNTAIRDIPQSITVLTEQFLQEIEALSPDEALAYVAGISQGESGAAGDDSLNLRGQGLTNRLLDGLPDNNPNTRPDQALIERVEVIKGAASSLYGASSPAGVVNSITKKPKDKPAYSFLLQVGSDDLRRGTADFTGPVNRSKTLLYRLVLASEGAGNFRDYVNSDRWMVAPSLAWKVGLRTQVTVAFEWLHSRQVSYPGLPIIGTDPLPVLPRERFLGSPDVEFETRKRAYRAFLDHRFNANWSARLGYVYTDFDAYKGNGQITGRVAANRRTINRQFGLQVIDGWEHTGQADLLGRFKTGPVSHRTLIGTDVRNEHRYLVNYNRTATPAIDIFNPVYVPPTAFGAINTNAHNIANSTSAGFYVQEHASLLEERLQFVAGLRYDTLKQISTSYTVGTVASDFTPPDVLTPRVGVVLRPWRAVSVYGTYGESFRPDTSGRPIFGTDAKLEPETGILKEIGVKADFFDSRLSLNAAFYDIAKENIVSADSEHPGFVIQDGRQESRGFEVAFNLDPAPGFSVFGGYNYVDASVTVDPGNNSTAGRPLPNTPMHSFQLWAKYQIRSGPLARLGFGAGANYVDDRMGRPSNNPVIRSIPSYSVFNVQANYAWRRYRFNVYVSNVFDKHYWANGAVSTMIPGAPLGVRASVRTTF